jgi:uncharacterized protein
MHWLNEPTTWSQADGALTVTAGAGTDFWRVTGYGFIRDNGHLYGTAVAGDFDLTLELNGAFAAQYDQAGAMVRADERTWVKTGIEFVEGRPRFSTVVTAEQSSWAIAALPDGVTGLRLELSRRGDALEVRYALAGAPPELAAIAYLPPGREVLAGAMCAAPDGPGFDVTFRDLTVRPAD